MKDFIAKVGDWFTREPQVQETVIDLTTEYPAVPAETFARRNLARLEDAIARNANAHSLDEATGYVFDELIDSWRMQENAKVDSTIDRQQADLRHERAQLDAARFQVEQLLEREQDEWLRVNQELTAATFAASRGQTEPANSQ